MGPNTQAVLRKQLLLHDVKLFWKLWCGTVKIIESFRVMTGVGVARVFVPGIGTVKTEKGPTLWDPTVNRLVFSPVVISQPTPLIHGGKSGRGTNSRWPRR